MLRPRLPKRRDALNGWGTVCLSRNLRIKARIWGAEASDQLTERGGIQVARTIVHSRRASTERTPVGAGERRQKKISVIVPVSEAVLDLAGVKEAFGRQRTRERCRY